jgi:uncharacterized protein (DUF2252 family)
MKQDVQSTAAELKAGRDLRKAVPPSDLAVLPDGVRQPLDIIAQQNQNRVPDLVPVRRERMSASPFTFYRGTAALMAADLGAAPHTGVTVASCGDAHVSNFGFYASPQRTLVFDLNDFDESAWAPWEWDLKRLTASAIIGARDGGHHDDFAAQAARKTVTSYGAAMRAALAMTPTERFYSHLNAEAGVGKLGKKSRAVAQAAVDKAHQRTGDRAAHKLTEIAPDGRLRFIERPPTMAHISEESVAAVNAHLDLYTGSTTPDVHLLLQQYEVVDHARRVVGVGSVGTRCTLTLFQDGDGHSLILQAKEATTSVLEQYGKVRQPQQFRHTVETHGEGARVVGLQRILQALSDPFLGYLRADTDLYVRQFHDMKGGIDVSGLDRKPFLAYVRACAIRLARAHSQSPYTATIVGYLGDDHAVRDAIVEWSFAYADLSAADYAAFTAEP